MIYNITHDFIQISESSATLQNLKSNVTLELVVSTKQPENDSAGILIFPREKYSYALNNGKKIFVRCTKPGQMAKAAVIENDYASGVSIVVSDTQPINQNPGDIWVDTSERPDK